MMYISDWRYCSKKCSDEVVEFAEFIINSAYIIDWRYCSKKCADDVVEFMFINSAYVIDWRYYSKQYEVARFSKFINDWSDCADVVVESNVEREFSNSIWQCAKNDRFSIELEICAAKLLTVRSKNMSEICFSDEINRRWAMLQEFTQREILLLTRCKFRDCIFEVDDVCNFDISSEDRERYNSSSVSSSDRSLNKTFAVWESNSLRFSMSHTFVAVWCSESVDELFEELFECCVLFNSCSRWFSDNFFLLFRVDFIECFLTLFCLSLVKSSSCCNVDRLCFKANLMTLFSISSTMMKLHWIIFSASISRKRFFVISSRGSCNNIIHLRC